MFKDRQTTLTAFVIAAIVGQAAFELYAWLVSPVLFGPSLQPANLVVALTALFTGIKLSYGAAFVLHLLIGSFGFAAFVLMTKRISGLGYRAAGALAGLILWFVAQGIFAPVIGRDFMMGFGAYTQSSFIGHVGMAFVMGVVLHMFDNRNATTDQAPIAS
jgi:uncharacterized membrane protein YagU involved in acid resistance